jgi:nicotinamidase-related amidase
VRGRAVGSGLALRAGTRSSDALTARVHATQCRARPLRTTVDVLTGQGSPGPRGLAFAGMDRFNDLDIPESLDDALKPWTLALVVYDMQVGILSQIADSERVLANVLRVLAAARERSVRTVFLRHYSMPTELAGVFQLRQAKVWQHKAHASETRPLIPSGAPGFELTPALEPRASEAVIDKITMSAFEGTPLDIVLRDCGVRAYLIVGVALEVGIEPTVRHSADLGYVPIVVRDACGSGDAAAGQRALEALMFAGDAIVADTDAVTASLMGATPEDG